MPFSTNIRSFLAPTCSDLVRCYLILISVELALKDAKFSGKSSHDVPGMLLHAAESPAVAQKNGMEVQLRGLATTLSNSLNAISCIGVTGKIERVPTTSYPYLRYCRCEGDWGGVQETSAVRISQLLHDCNNLYTVLRSIGKTIGVKL